MRLFIAAAAESASLIGASARAADYSFNLTGGPEIFTGTLSTTNAGNAKLVSSLSGTLNGAPASLDPNATGTDISGDSAGYHDQHGIVFSANGFQNVIYYAGASLYKLNISSGFDYLGSFSLTQETGVFHQPQNRAFGRSCLVGLALWA